MDKEKLIKKIMAEAEKDGEPLTRAEAEEVADMEIKAKGVKNYVKSDKERKPRKKPDLDATKVKLIEQFFEYLGAGADFEAVSVLNPQREVSFDYLGENYSIVLTRHRKEKSTK